MVVVDAKGQHITPGIIDCHSHMGTDGGGEKLDRTKQDEGYGKMVSIVESAVRTV